MLLEESLWFKYVINKYVKPYSLVLNIGSSDKHFIENIQPYIKSNVIDELNKKQCSLKNIDIKPCEGVDLVGDVTDISFINQINALNPDVIICSNLLEHLDNRQAFCEGLMKMTSGSTILIVSVPHSFPYHEDPIDTLYRPNVNDLKKAFASLFLMEGTIVKCGTYYSYINQHEKKGFTFVNYLRICRATLRAFFINRERFLSLLWYFRKISVSCGVFKKL